MVTMLLIIVEQTLLHLPLMLGAYISFSLLKVPDLSIESAYIVGAIVGTFALTHLAMLPLGMTICIVLIASFFGGALVGCTSSVLTQKAHIPHLLSSIITFGLFQGVNQSISGSYVSLSKTANPLRILDHFAHYPELSTVGAIAFFIVILVYLLFRTQLGYAYAVYGNNPRFFNNYGVSTSYVFITGVMIANGLAGISGYMFAQSNNFYELNMGLGKALLCITALVLGKSLVRTKKPFSIGVPLVGTCAYFALQQLLLKGGFNLKYFTAVQALLVLCIVVYTYRKQPCNDNLGV